MCAAAVLGLWLSTAAASQATRTGLAFAHRHPLPCISLATAKWVGSSCSRERGQDCLRRVGEGQRATRMLFGDVGVSAFRCLHVCTHVFLIVFLEDGLCMHVCFNSVL